MSTSPDEHRSQAPDQVSFAVVTVSDSRTLETDKSGNRIVELMQAAGHQLASRTIVPDEPDRIADATLPLIRSKVGAVIITGGTGIARRDCTPEAVRPLLDVTLPGFGELFRLLSFEEIGTAAMLSRAMAGRADRSVVFCLPGSTAAVTLAVERLIVPEIKHLVFHSIG